MGWELGVLVNLKECENGCKIFSVRSNSFVACLFMFYAERCLMHNSYNSVIKNTKIRIIM